MATPEGYWSYSVVSGVLWGLAGAWIGFPVLAGTIWGGLIASPLIGLACGFAARRLIHLSFGGLALLALANLHLGAALFALACGLYDWLARDIPGRNLEVVYQGVPMVLWGLTVSGWVFLLWPLAIANHWWLAREA